jgi:hypothetical protein
LPSLRGGSAARVGVQRQIREIPGSPLTITPRSKSAKVLRTVLTRSRPQSTVTMDTHGGTAERQNGGAAHMAEESPRGLNPINHQRWRRVAPPPAEARIRRSHGARKRSSVLTSSIGSAAPFTVPPANQPQRQGESWSRCQAMEAKVTGKGGAEAILVHPRRGVRGQA